MQGFTSGAAYAAGMENRLGKLVAGFYADLLLLDQNPFQISPEQLRDLLPAGTMIAGKWVYTNPQIEDLISSA
jgi:predicted amidohydrolase YtcJ